ncbi:MAG: hypothetical protein Q4F60_02285 [Candidatus Saccharibacteria bacterium]|nr:hypothetical protein [Candidatus Saccharibacteria bacterium]
MTNILNLTQYEATTDQLEAGVIEPDFGKEFIKELLTFEQHPTETEIRNRARRLAATALDISRGKRGKVMIDSASCLTPALIVELKKMGFTPLFSVTRRRTEKVVQSDGSVRKLAVLRHIGWVQP